jgi:hypothetical protein
METKARKKLYNRIYVAKRRAKDTEADNARMREFRKNNPQSLEQKRNARGRAIKCRYGITLATYEQMIADQNGLCKLCQNFPKSPGKTCGLVIDHCHVTGKIRGLLCHGCNRSMALLDNPDLLAKAVKYRDQTDG